jgi:iron complex outermembrane receptor protein
MSKHGLFAGFSLLALIAAGAARAEETPLAAGAAAAAPAADTVQEVVVTADKVGLLEKKPSSTVFGFDKSLLETPRSATFVSDTTLERYGITTIDNLVEISPSSYTASFYGVPGSLNIRGTLAEDYFEGFKRVENRGTYSTPIGDASEIEIVRGPPNPIFGAGKVGGLLNFIPKTAKDTGAYLTEPTGEVSATFGSYSKKEVTAQGGAPVSIGPAQGGVYGYLDLDDSHSFYRGIYPKRQTAEVSADFNLPDGWTTAFQGMVYHSDGDVQTAGWNRITQNLIDNGTYITGRNASSLLTDTNGDGRIDSNEAGSYKPYGPYGGAFAQLACYYYTCTNGVHQLTTDVGTAHLSPQTVDISRADFSRTTTYTTYFNVAKKLTDKTGLKFELFYDDLNNERFVSYGFPASYQTYITEGRATYNFDIDGWNGLVKSKSFVGASYRYTDAHLRESFNSGIIAFDRRDLAEGPSATDIIASPFETINGQPGWPWDLDVHSNIRDAGVFFTTDITLLDRVDLIVGARDDDYNVSSNDLGVLTYEAASAVHAHADKSKGTYNVSLSYKTDWGLIPYYTYDQAAALELDQAGDLQPGTIATKGWLSDSYLSEVGVKFQELHSTLVGSLAFYRQTRTQLVQGAGGPASIVGTRSKGVELEVRYLATKNITFTYAGDIQHTEVKGPDSSFVDLPPSAFGVSGVNGYGGSYLGDIDSTPGRGGDYNDAIIPHSVNSVYGTYTSDAYNWGKAGVTFGVTHVSKTSTLLQNPVVYPDYWLANLSGFYQYGPYTLSLNIDNLFDKLYFTPNSDPTYANVAAIPGVGREWRLKLKRKF